MAQSAWPWPTFPDPLKSEPTIPSYFSLPYKQNVESGFLLLKRKQFLQIWAEEHDSYLLSLSFFFPPFKNICQTPWLDLIPWTNISLPLLLLGPTPPVSLLAETPCSALQSGSPGSSVQLLFFFFFLCVWACEGKEQGNNPVTRPFLTSHVSLLTSELPFSASVRTYHH